MRGGRDPSSPNLEFERLADELATRLEALGHVAAMTRAAEGRALAAAFRRWGAAPPSDDERASAIHALLDFNRCALQLLTASR